MPHLAAAAPAPGRLTDAERQDILLEMLRSFHFALLTVAPTYHYSTHAEAVAEQLRRLDADKAARAPARAPDAG